MISGICKWSIITALMLNLTGTPIQPTVYKSDKQLATLNIVKEDATNLKLKTTDLNNKITNETKSIDSKIVNISNTNKKTLELIKLREIAINSLKNYNILLCGSSSLGSISVPNAFEILTASSITSLDDYSLRCKSNLTAEQINKILVGSGLSNMGPSFIKAEKIFNVSALALMAIAVHESDWGNSNLSITKNNIVGYEAYDSNVDAAKIFATKGDCIMTIADVLDKDYLTPTGPYYNGLTLKSINICYASDKIWYIGVQNAMVTLLSKLQ